MAGKKKTENFMKEITSEKEWNALCEYKGGLTIVDIYSEWAGPCTAMSGALKKIKLEVGDDSLIYAMAKSDSIPQLEMFRGHCKPTYLFIASGQPVAVMHGANAPLMKTMVAEQMEIERKVLAGEVSRSVITIEEAIPVSELETAGNKQNEEKQANDKNEWLQEMKKEASKKKEDEQKNGEEDGNVCDEKSEIDPGQEQTQEGEKTEEEPENIKQEDTPLEENKEEEDVIENNSEENENKNDKNNNET